jgi:hypothetical protein
MLFNNYSKAYASMVYEAMSCAQIVVRAYNAYRLAIAFTEKGAD